MLRMSVLAAPLGPLTQYLHLFDYWQPQTLTGTALGIEDIGIAFAIGGITAAMYSMVMYPRERRERGGVLPIIASAYVLGTALLYGGFFILGLSSVTVTFLTLGLFAAIPLVAKPWLVRGALLTGCMFGGFLFLFEAAFFAAYPGIVDAWWFGAAWGRVWGVPYEEIVWGVLWGVAGASGTELALRIRTRIPGMYSSAVAQDREPPHS